MDTHEEVICLDHILNQPDNDPPRKTHPSTPVESPSGQRETRETSIGILRTPRLAIDCCQPYVPCWHTIWIRDRKPSWGPEFWRKGWMERGRREWRNKFLLGQVGMNVLPNGDVWCTVFYTTPQTKRLKKIVVFVFLCFCLIYMIYTCTLFSCLICMCIYIYTYSTLYLCGCNENWEETSWRHRGLPIITDIVIMAVIIINNINHIKISIDVRNAPCPTTRLSWFIHLQGSLVGYSLYVNCWASSCTIRRNVKTHILC